MLTLSTAAPANVSAFADLCRDSDKVCIDDDGVLRIKIRDLKQYLSVRALCGDGVDTQGQGYAYRVCSGARVKGDGNARNVASQNGTYILKT